MICEREISQNEYDDYLARLKHANETFSGNVKKKKIAKIHATIERDLDVIGSTAVQDNL